MFPSISNFRNENTTVKVQHSVQDIWVNNYIINYSPFPSVFSENLCELKLKIDISSEKKNLSGETDKNMSIIIIRMKLNITL